METLRDKYKIVDVEMEAMGAELLRLRSQIADLPSDTNSDVGMIKRRKAEDMIKEMTYVQLGAAKIKYR